MVRLQEGLSGGRLQVPGGREGGLSLAVVGLEKLLEFCFFSL